MASDEAAPTVLLRRRIGSPVGPLTLVCTETALAAILWPDDRPGRVPFAAAATFGDHPLLDAAEDQLGDYFAGRRRRFDLPLRFVGTTFQQAVWSALLTIPYGATRTYAAIARQVGRPSAVRAVGAANGRNPISIVAPCHRVVGSNGSLTGFAGGLDAKARLLSLERGGFSPDQSSIVSCS